jgi:hypothetical protein
MKVFGMFNKQCSMNNVQCWLRRTIVCRTDETDSRKEKNGTKNEVDNNLLHIPRSATRLHKVHRAKD